jgi:hypothetical protein
MRAQGRPLRPDQLRGRGGLLTDNIKGDALPSEVRRVVLYFSPEDYGVFEKTVLQNGGSTARRGNLVNKELALMALVKKAAISK